MSLAADFLTTKTSIFPNGDDPGLPNEVRYPSVERCSTYIKNPAFIPEPREPDTFVYIVGSLRNPLIPQVAQSIREKCNVEVFDDWYSAGPEADDKWREYEIAKGNTYWDALEGYAAKNVFRFDKTHLDRATHVVLVLPAGRSGHLELGYAAGQQKQTAVLFDADYDRWDVMYQFAKVRTQSLLEITDWIKNGR